MFKNNPPLSDVDYVIENAETGELKVFSFTEYFNNFVSHYAKSDSCSKVLLAHFNHHNLYYWMKKEGHIKSMDKIKPWIFPPFHEYNVDYFRKIRQTSVLNEKLFWQGSGIEAYRLVIKLLKDEAYFQPIDPTDHNAYLLRLSKSKIALSYYMDLDKYITPFDHPGEFCYRDNEYLSLGVPYIRIEYKDNVHDPLLPNYHYISIPREEAHFAFRTKGNEGVKELIRDKYFEVYQDNDFLNFISKNQIEWYERNYRNRFELTFNLLELNQWVDLEKDKINIINSNFLNTIESEQEEPHLIITHIEQEESYPNTEDTYQEINNTQEIMENKNAVKGCTEYKGYSAQQHDDAFDVFRKFLTDIKPARVLEIGTAGGGFTLFIRDVLNEIGLQDVPIKSFDVVDPGWYDKIRENNINIIIENCFDQAYINIEKPDHLIPFIQQPGTTLVLCDGGHKIGEFNALSPHIKVGDFIMAHDYVDTWENYKENYVDKIWNWCEIEEKYIADISKECNLEFYNKEIFDKVVWVCKRKTLPL
jgi:cephalosporin hydroxylase